MTLLDELRKLQARSLAIIAGLALLTLLGFSGKPLADTAEYELGPQDRLRIHVSEWPALTGELSVGASGDILMPMLGQVRAKGLSAPELATSIASRLKAKANLQQTPDTTVDIVAYRPFYILGSVASPGEYAYRPGMIILNALSLGGGAYRAEQGSQWDLERVAISSRGELKLNEARRWDLLAEQQRWQAQLDGADKMSSVPGDASPEFAKAVEEQSRLFVMELGRYRAERLSLEASIAMRRQEIAALDRQLADVALKLSSTQGELETIRRLAKQDLAVHRLGPLERSLSDVQREQQDLEIAKLRARQEINTATGEIASLDEQRRATALAGAQRIAVDLRAIAEQNDTSARILDSAAHYSSNLSRLIDAESTPQLRFSIVRTDDNGTVEFDATETTRVQPGDIVKVFRVAAETTGTLPVKTQSTRP
ncbi:protein involved in polysaccharide export with SLBB domain [Aminobacter lissarensis]|uniref:Protein involved in polysaccharide export with SLBB domain n=1 Tax=Aminobacter carboxidus TaxID=376165 RepID=A0A8E1WGJ1_9HYPH|nr:polysaccharide biosynthesis/export family protein [Aminobacter lissarensis]MBB6468481.1 protein involved in polysaccharide export with SLBB domain [Aminobacter lissarensis]